MSTATSARNTQDTRRDRQDLRQDKDVLRRDGPQLRQEERAPANAGQPHQDRQHLRHDRLNLSPDRRELQADRQHRRGSRQRTKQINARCTMIGETYKSTVRRIEDGPPRSRRTWIANNHVDRSQALVQILSRGSDSFLRTHKQKRSRVRPGCACQPLSRGFARRLMVAECKPTARPISERL